MLCINAGLSISFEVDIPKLKLGLAGYFSGFKVIIAQYLYYDSNFF